MFELEEQLERWKKHFTSMEGMRRGDIEELEQHVRDSIAALTSLGLNPEEAFVLATYRVGAPGVVSREFAKVNGTYLWSHRGFWMTAGALAYVICGLLIGAIVSLSQVMVSLAGGEGLAVGYMAVSITCLGWSVVAALLYRQRNQHAGPVVVQGLPARLIVGSVVFAVAATSSIRLGGDFLLPQLMPIPELGRALLISNVAAMMSTVLMPLMLVIVMLLLGRHMSERLS